MIEQYERIFKINVFKMFKETMEGIESIRREIIKPDQLRYGKKQIEILEIKNNSL